MEVKPKVAIVESNSFITALDVIGGLGDLNSPDRRVVVKVGIYDPKTGICTTVDTVQSIIDAFDQAPEIMIAESDSGAGPGLARLQIWQKCFSDRVVPFNLSEDKETRMVEVAGERVPFAQVLFEPKTFISTHVLRRYEEAGLEDLMNLGFGIKNLLGLILDTKKHRFHDRLPIALLDMYEAAGGIDLAVLDATHVYLGRRKKRKRVSSRLLLVGTDAFAVEAVGGYLVGFDPTRMPVLQEAKNRGLGEIDIAKINIIGDIDTPKRMIAKAFETMK